jgi:putative acetyltransferase
MDIAIEQVNVPTAEAVELLAELDTALAGSYAGDQRHARSIERSFLPNVRFFLVRLGGVAVACGSVDFSDGYAEVRRMFSKPPVRGRGVAKALLQRLEAEARAAGSTVLRIETGIYQQEALRFFEGAGFTRCGPFGPYAAMRPRAAEISLFYEKPL